jgi:hypothetical protein
MEIDIMKKDKIDTGIPEQLLKIYTGKKSNEPMSASKMQEKTTES